MNKKTQRRMERVEKMLLRFADRCAVEARALRSLKRPNHHHGTAAAHLDSVEYDLRARAHRIGQAEQLTLPTISDQGTAECGVPVSRRVYPNA